MLCERMCLRFCFLTPRLHERMVDDSSKYEFGVICTVVKHFNFTLLPVLVQKNQPRAVFFVHLKMLTLKRIVFLLFLIQMGPLYIPLYIKFLRYFM